MTDLRAALPPARLPKPNDPCWCGSGKKYKKCHSGQDTMLVRAQVSERDAKRIRPGLISPKRPVPAHIQGPDYARTGRPGSREEPDVKSPDVIARMRRACKLAAEVLQEAGKHVRAGVTTDALDAIAHEFCVSRGAYPSPLNYHGFPKSICTSVNEVICHGIPDSRVLEDGDIVNLDITVYLDGVHGDTNATFFVGHVDSESRKLVDVTRECLERGIAAVKPGRPIREIGRAIQVLAEGHGYGVVRAYCGHGIGERFHTSLQIPHVDDPDARTLIEPGMTFTIEPMISLGDWRHRLWDDGWTAVTLDGRRSAQFEHTILVTPTGAEILTQV
ncbi:MAG: type I methionyl aminopeptidase [Myxococcaceae bacterium]|nr:type I methionyl aminopeptidase [Myxococcaceae bacterium]MCI0671651.1 type I methionyl aminopeptidase [Myxococcaceae bacterium]